MALFMQLWPLIKSKVKDPSLLIRTINSISGTDGNFDSENNKQMEEQALLIEDLTSKIEQFSQRESSILLQLEQEQAQRMKAEMRAQEAIKKLKEY